MVPARSLRMSTLAGLFRELLEGAFLAVPVLFATILLGSVLIALLGTAPAGPLPASGTNTRSPAPPPCGR